MQRIANAEVLNQVCQSAKTKIDACKCRILICAGTGCLAGGSGEIYEEMCRLAKDNPDVEIDFKPEIACAGLPGHGLEEEARAAVEKIAGARKNAGASGVKEEDLDDFAVKKSGCHGFCEMGPLMRIEPLGILYTKVSVDDCKAIFERTVKNGDIIRELLYKQDGIEYARQEDIPFYKKQTRVVLENCGHIDAEHIEEYIARGGIQDRLQVEPGCPSARKAALRRM